MSIKSNVKMEWEGDIVKIQGRKVVNKTAFELGLIIEGQAKLLCPVDYGYLAASINVQTIGKGTELGKVMGKSIVTKTQTIGEKTKYTKPKADHKSFWENMPEGFEKITPSNNPDEVYVGTAVEYGPYIEFGTMKMDAQPFLRPAADLAQGKELTLLKENGKFYFADYLRRPV